MVLNDTDNQPGETLRQSWQYRMPEWLAPVAEVMLYEAALRATQSVTDWAFEAGNRWWHNAGEYRFINVIKDSRGKPNNEVGVPSRIDRVEDSKGKRWLRKTDPRCI